VNDSVRNSAICGVTQSQGENAGVSGGAAGNNGMDWMDDPNMDPDLALAIRVSLEESRARQQQELTNSSSVNVPSAIEEGAENTQNINSDAQNAENEENRREEIEITMQEDDEVLMQALQMSLANNENSAESENNEENSNLEVGNENENMVEATAVETDSIAESMTEEEQIELALRMSLAENEEKEEENNDDMKE